MRRVPAERARHAKRLGHVQPIPAILIGNEVIPTTTTTTSSQSPPHSTSTTSTVTSTKQSSSSAPPSSTSTQSSSSPQSSVPPSSTSSLPLSGSSSSSPVPTTTLSSSVLQPIASTPAPSSSSPSSAGAVSHGLSGSAIAGIITGAVLVGIALIVFLIRKTYLRRREKRRISWTQAPALGAGTLLDEPKFVPDANIHLPSGTSQANIPRGGPFSPFTFDGRGRPAYSTPPPSVQPRAMPAYGIPPPPSATYNNPAYPMQPVPSLYNRGSTVTTPRPITPTVPSTGSHRAPTDAIVKCTFVPTLPDELSIITGERVFVVEQYDDGWDLCMNRRGERGMVPHECLELAPSDQINIGWKNVQRTTSLNLDGKRY